MMSIAVLAAPTGQGGGTMLKRVLIPTDGSETAGKALHFASQLLERSGCRIVLLSVVEEPVYSTLWSDGLIAPEVVVPPPHVLREKLEEQASSVLEEAARHLREAGIDAEIKVRFGHPAGEILQELEEEDYDLVVVGSHGHGPLRGLLLGSVSNRVAQHAPCPVLIVR